jgi:hypothetical protein
VKLKLIYDGQSVGQSVLVSGTQLGTRDQFFFLLEISFRQLRVCYFVAPSLTRGRVCNLLVQLLLSLARAVTLGSKSRRTHGLILLSHLRLPQPGRPGPRIYITQEQGGPVIPSGTGFPFCRLLSSQGYGGGIRLYIVVVISEANKSGKQSEQRFIVTLLNTWQYYYYYYYYYYYGTNKEVKWSLCLCRVETG